jgi:hypothetical protein
MADRAGNGLFDDISRRDKGPLLRIAAWGLAATGALAIAVFASRSEIGERRISLAASASNATQADAARLASAQALARAAEAEREARGLAETVRTLTSDRDQLASRIAALERSLEDLTGSISLTQPLTRRPAMVDMLLPPTGSSLLLRPGGAGTASDLTSSPGSTRPFGAPEARPSTFGPPASGAADTPAGAAADPTASEIPLPRPNPLGANQTAAAPAAGRLTASQSAAADAAGASVATGNQRFGVDLGGASSVEGLRALWTRVKEGQSALVADLKPVVSVRDAAQPGTVELRLVAGPVPSAVAASRLCAALASSGTACRAAAFDGQALTGP